MKSFFQKLNARLSTAFQGCNGADTLGRWAMGLGLLFALLDIFFYNAVLTVLYMVCLFYAIYRLFSHNVAQRQKENARFEKLIEKPKNALRRMRGKTASSEALHIKCEECGQRLSVPKGKGHIRVICPTCKHETTMHT